ncbi:probable tRNA(His) guanylyltransferase [Anopheles darlingi]|uniref:probable tRNA(His) guanylyltransferase n=1 Tax=Anopheles darlingi TaxID=43151 RepID=UPI0021003F79|nr:probable tRNA(His) guanylyltransferase [Anopheles darlingi]
MLLKIGFSGNFRTRAASASKRSFHCAFTMALSRFEYVKQFEQEDKLLPNSWIVVRIDGKGFHRFCEVHKFAKPNDLDALQLMNMAGMSVMQEFNEIAIGYGQSDEYSFVFRREANVYQRRRDKLISYVASLFTSAYMFHWNRIFERRSLSICYPPSFDARAVLYPTDENLRDYLSWRQADVHVNNLYNTTFWNLVASGLSNSEAERELQGTLASDKNEILFSKFGINYNNEPIMYRKGTILLRKPVKVADSVKKLIVPIFEDLINDEFWVRHPEILDKKSTTTKGEDAVLQLSGLEEQPIVSYQLEVLQRKKAGIAEASARSSLPSK